MSMGQTLGRELTLVLDVPSIALWLFWRQSDVPLTLDTFFAGICRLLKEHETTSVIWCFDDNRSLRRDALPCYKEKRKELEGKRDPELQERVLQCKRLISQLRDEILKDFGYFPVWQNGLEADDMIALICKKRQLRRKMIVSTDADLWQLLDSQTTMFSPSQGKYYTATWFEKEYGILPKMWSLVKAIAGCASDNVPGVPGIGEKSAIKYILGTLYGKKLQLIEANMDLIYFNRGLVKLPHKAALPTPSDIFTDTSEKEWRAACKRWDVGIWANNLDGWYPNPGEGF